MERVRICLHGSWRGVRNCSSKHLCTKPQPKLDGTDTPKTLLAFTRGNGNRDVGTEPIFIRSVPEKDRNRLRSFSGTDRVRMERIKFD